MFNWRYYSNNEYTKVNSQESEELKPNNEKNIHQPNENNKISSFKYIIILFALALLLAFIFKNYSLHKNEGELYRNVPSDVDIFPNTNENQTAGEEVHDDGTTHLSKKPLSKQLKKKERAKAKAQLKRQRKIEREKTFYEKYQTNLSSIRTNTAVKTDVIDAFENCYLNKEEWKTDNFSATNYVGNDIGNYMSFPNVNQKSLPLQDNYNIPNRKVMAQNIPKSGSTALRLYFSQLFQTEGPHTSIHITDEKDAVKYDDYYKFALVTDPLLHILRGILQCHEECKFVTKVFSYFDLNKYNKNHTQSKKFINLLNLALEDAIKKLERQGKFGPGRFNQHIAPQTWHLRRAAYFGMKYDFIGPFDRNNWSILNQDMNHKGYVSFNESMLDQVKNTRHGNHVVRTNKKYNEDTYYQFSDFMQFIEPQVLKLMCKYTKIEFDCLGMPINKACIDVI